MGGSHDHTFNLVSKLANQWIDLFRAGDYGDKGAYTESDLDQVVNNYNSAAAANFQDTEQHEAPSTYGHPKSGDPAYGWWSKLRRVGGLLQGQMGKVQPEFEDAVDRELYKKRSVGLQKTAKGWTLHHVAWLGAQAPQVKGLANVSFEADNTMTEIDFSEETSMFTEADKKSLSESIIDGIKGLFTHKPGEAPKVFSEADVQAKIDAATAALEAKIAGLTTQFSERDKALATAETKQRADAAIARLRAKGAWVPAMAVMGLPIVFAELAKVTGTVEFGEGDKKANKTPLEIFTEFMESGGPLVPTGRKVEPPSGAPKTATFNETPQTPVDRNSVLFHEEITKVMDADPKLDYRAAMRKVAEQHPELTRPGSSTSGAV